MSQKSTTLNPSATEFVPNFAMPNMSGLSLNDKKQEENTSYQAPTHENRYQNNYHQQNYYQQQHQGGGGGGGYNQQPQQQRFYGQNHNTSHRHTYNPNYRGNNYRHNHRNSNYNNYHYNNQHNYHHQQQQQQQQPYDVDAFELEARCEAVVEILQDDKIRGQLNPQSLTDNCEEEIRHDEEADGIDEDELDEMMAMQEECRLEMMKFYIQSQNPTLFEELYHDVSYPDAAAAKAKTHEDELLSPKSINLSTESDSKKDDSQKTEQSSDITLKELIINELNPEVAEFVPKKFSGEESNKSA